MTRACPACLGSDDDPVQTFIAHRHFFDGPRRPQSQGVWTCAKCIQRIRLAGGLGPHQEPKPHRPSNDQNHFIFPNTDSSRRNGRAVETARSLTFAANRDRSVADLFPTNLPPRCNRDAPTPSQPAPKGHPAPQGVSPRSRPALNRQASRHSVEHTTSSVASFSHTMHRPSSGPGTQVASELAVGVQILAQIVWLPKWSSYVHNSSWYTTPTAAP